MSAFWQSLFPLFRRDAPGRTEADLADVPTAAASDASSDEAPAEPVVSEPTPDVSEPPSTPPMDEPAAETTVVALPELSIVHYPCMTADVESVLDGSLQRHLRESAASILDAMDALLARTPPAGMAFDRFRDARDQRVIVVHPEDGDPSNLWFIGDVHGDLLGLECALRYIDAVSGEVPPTLVLLGDLIDDGPYDFEVILRVFERMIQCKDRVCVITGNHDEGLSQKGDQFVSTVLPSTFCDWLNVHADDPTVVRLGKLVIDFFRQAPVAIFLPDGLLVSHGGMPHSDLLDGIVNPADFNSAACIQDFIWTRIHPRARRRIPNRTTRGCELGREDAERFCAKAAEILGQPVERIIRGHDHLDTQERVALFEKYVNTPVLTINNMCFRLERELFGPYEHRPCLARWIPGQLPEVHCLDIEDAWIHAVYPREFAEEIPETCESEQDDDTPGDARPAGAPPETAPPEVAP